MSDEIMVRPEVVDVSVVEQLTRGEVDMQVATANRYPRSIDTFKKKALTMATKDAETAQSCFYVLPRGGKKIEGPSVRLAEIVAASYKNLRCETRVVGVAEKTVTAQATVWDMENNVLMRCETSRRITDKTGKRYSDDMIVMTGNAAASIALRNAIWKVVPFAHVKPIYEQCKRVALGGKGVDQAKQDWLNYFKKNGVSNSRVLAMLGKGHIDDMDLDDVSTLQGIVTALDESSTSIDEVFPPERPAEGNFGFTKKAKDAKKAKTPQAEPNEPPPPSDDDEPWAKHVNP